MRRALFLAGAKLLALAFGLHARLARKAGVLLRRARQQENDPNRCDDGRADRDREQSAAASLPRLQQRDFVGERLHGPAVVGCGRCEHRAHPGCARRTFLGPLGEQPQRQLTHADRNTAARNEGRDRILQDAIARDLGIERRVSRNQLIEERAVGIEVIEGLRGFAAQLLGTRVVRRSARRDGAGERGQAEIAESRAALAVEENVRALEVAVHESARMQGLERRGHVVGGARPAFE